MNKDSTNEKISEELIDQTLADSFPASDPPSWTLGRERSKTSSTPENCSKAAQPSESGEKKPGRPRNED